MELSTVAKTQTKKLNSSGVSDSEKSTRSTEIAGRLSSSINEITCTNVKKSTKIKNKNIFNKGNSCLKCIYTNATSLVNKWDEFNSLVQANDFPHIIMITETWFNSMSIKHLSNYSLFNRDREELIGGGVAIYVRNDIDAYEANDFCFSQRCTEQAWCYIHIGTEKVLLGCIYRPPYASRETNMEINHTITRARMMIDKKNSQVS